MCAADLDLLVFKVPMPLSQDLVPSPGKGETNHPSRGGAFFLPPLEAGISVVGWWGKRGSGCREPAASEGMKTVLEGGRCSSGLLFFHVSIQSASPALLASSGSGHLTALAFALPLLPSHPVTTIASSRTFLRFQFQCYLLLLCYLLQEL